MSNLYSTGIINIGKNKKRYQKKIFKLLDYLNGVSFSRQQINYLKPLFIENCEGDVLEIGGYDSFFKNEYKKGQFLNFDIKDSQHVDIVGNAEEMPEIRTESFSAVICISVLEHTYNPENMIREIHRVLKKNGQLYISVPWMFESHMEPNDYLRFSDSYMDGLFEKIGFDIEIKKACNSVFGAVAHFLQRRVVSRLSFGFLFAIFETLSVPSYKYTTQVSYFLRKRERRY